MSKDKNNKIIRGKQNKNRKLSKEKNKKNIFKLAILFIFMLAFLLFGILKINSSSNDNKKLMKKFEEKYNSSKMEILFYFDGQNVDDSITIEESYLIQLKKDYNIDYLELDVSKISKKDKENIDNKLGISGDTPSIIIVEDRKIVAVQEGFIESHNLVSLFIKLNILKKDCKYKTIDNLVFVNYDNYKELIEKKKDSIVVVGKAACKYCESVKPIFNNISKAYNEKINYLDLSDLSQNDIKEFFDEIPKQGYKEEKLKNDGSFNTPTLLILKNGKIDSYLEGARTLEEYVNYLKDNKMIE